MRILFITGSYPPDRCGVGDYTYQLATTLAGLPETEVSILTTAITTDAMEQHNVAVRRSLPDWSLRSLRSLVREFRQGRPDIVHVQYPTQGYSGGGLPWLIPAVAHLCGARVVQTWHERFNRRDLPKFLAMALTPGRTIVVRKTWLNQFTGLFRPIARWRRPICINSGSNLPPSSLTQTEAEALRLRYAVGGRRLIVFFGFIHPLKRIELLFEIADPETDHVLVIGNIGDQTDYAARIERLTEEERWCGHARVVGFVDRHEAADIIKTADALILPFQLGGSEVNTSILAGISQGTFVLTTSTLANGYEPDINTFYAAIDGLAEMRQALQAHAGKRRVANVDRGDAFDWTSIARQHLDLYRNMLSDGAAPHHSSRNDSA